MLIPFHSFIADYNIIHEFAMMAYPQNMSTWKEFLNWAWLHIPVLFSLIFTILFLGLQIVERLSKKDLNIFHQAMLGLFVICFLYVCYAERTIWDEDVVDQAYSHLQKISAQTIIISSLMIWITALYSYLDTATQNNSAANKLLYIFASVFYLALVLFYAYTPEQYRITVRLIMAIALLILTLQLFLHKKYPKKIITIIVPVLTIIAGLMEVALHDIVHVYRDYLPMMYLQMQAKDKCVKIVLLMMLPVITTIAFRFFTKRKDEIAET